VASAKKKTVQKLSDHTTYTVFPNLVRNGYGNYDHTKSFEATSRYWKYVLLKSKNIIL
jgi:hypothetical protein